MSNNIFTNALINESSPYLLQHAHNPVNWYPWGDEALEKAKREDKLIIVSIGYAACHWCHVMERESFQDEEVAKVMNEFFVCIKIDREERPDIDHYFMTAVQLIGAQGGWPLNCIALPDTKPVWGGTYFPKETWIKAMLEVNRMYNEQRNDTIRHAHNVAHGIRQALLTIQVGREDTASQQLIDKAVDKWRHHLDHKNGGRLGKPKFPMPVNLNFLLHYGHIRKNAEILNYVELTLEKMARGGIYDQIGGGFARYSVDDIWKVPHFEKMLYDNGQLLSVYSQAFQKTGNPLFKQVVYETVDWIEREMMHESGAFYSSLDADSEGVEGKYYVWSEAELQELLKDDFPAFAEYYNVNEHGFWEDGQYILMPVEHTAELCRKHGLTSKTLHDKIAGWKKTLLKYRNKRIPPALDDKTITSWNALVITGLCDAAKAFGDDRFKKLAQKNGRFIVKNLFRGGNRLYHTWKNGKASIYGFLEDYAHTTHAFISLWEITAEREWLDKAVVFNEFSLTAFLNDKQNLFYFSKTEIEEVISNHYQTEDNVMASSNSVTAINLLKLSRLLSKMDWDKLAGKIGENLVSNFSSYPYAFANWGLLYLLLSEGTREVAIVGDGSKPLMAALQKDFRPGIIWASSELVSQLPILQDRLVKGKTLIYVCQNGSCKLPVETLEEAQELLQ